MDDIENYRANVKTCNSRLQKLIPAFLLTSESAKILQKNPRDSH